MGWLVSLGVFVIIHVAVLGTRIAQLILIMFHFAAGRTKVLNYILMVGQCFLYAFYLFQVLFWIVDMNTAADRLKPFILYKIRLPQAGNGKQTVPLDTIKLLLSST